MLNCKTSLTPLETTVNLNKQNSCKGKMPYQQLIGSLMYLAVLTMPNIAFSFSYLSQFNNCYDESH